jgi:hypothetical protein
MRGGQTDLWHVNNPGCVKLSTIKRLSWPLAFGAMKTGTASSDCRFDEDEVRVELPGLRNEREKEVWGAAADPTLPEASPAPRRATM